ncbi:MAG: outer membrane beta-barrel protein [Treponema sp.]|nr:outer membrane beta-barrel protein [Treponema sp.]
MKKIILAAFLALGMVSSSFALNFSIGAKGLLGANVGTSVDGAMADVTEIVGDAESRANLLYGGGVYVDASLFGPVGLQLGANIGQNKVSVTDDDGNEVSTYKELLLDVPLMIWADFKLGPIGLGLGLGPNLSFSLGTDYTIAGATEAVKALLPEISVNKAVWGITAGANAKIYFNKHLALVAGGSYTLDLQKKEINLSTLQSGSLLEFKRSVLYANLGLEFKLL